MIQISGHSVFAFTEGFTDRYGYSRIIDPICDTHGASYSIVTAEEIPGSAGGKPALIACFEYARRQKMLSENFKGKRTVLFFFLDKDIDDFRRTKKRSRHVFYTTTYHFENLLFLHGDLLGSVGAAACVDKASLPSGMGDSKAWCARAAAAWQPWVEICAFSALKAKSPDAYYGRPISQINRTPYGATDPVLHQAEIRRLRNRWYDRTISFRTVMAQIHNSVQKAYNNGTADDLFKGKWYGAFARADVEASVRMRRWQRNGFEDRLLSCLATSADYDGRWTQDYRTGLDALLRWSGPRRNARKRKR